MVGLLGVQENIISGALPHGDDGAFVPGLCPSVPAALSIILEVL